MSDNISTISMMNDAYKEFFLPGLRDQMDYGASAFLAQVERNTESVVGSDIVITMSYGRVGGIGAMDENSAFPTANGAKFKKVIWETQDLAAVFQISDKAIEASKSTVGAFANMLERQFMTCERDAKIFIGRSVLGDGIGKLGIVSATATTWDGTAKTLTLTMDTSHPMVYLSEGMLVDVYASGATTVLSGGNCLEVIAVDDDLRTVVLKGLLADLTDIHAGIATGAFLVAQGSYGKELTGLAAVCDNTALQYGLSRTTYPWLKVPVNAAVGEINDMAIQALIDKAETRSGSTINFIQCAQDVKRAYINYKAALRQTVDSLDIKGGFKAMSYNNGGKEIPIMPDKYLPDGYMDGMDTRDWALYAMNDWSWREQGGGILTKVAGKPAWGAELIRFCDIGCQRPRGQFRAAGIQGA